MAVDLGQHGKGQSSRSVRTDGLCSRPRSAAAHGSGVPSSCPDQGGTGKGLRVPSSRCFT